MAPIPAVVARLRPEHLDDTGRICPSPGRRYGNACQFRLTSRGAGGPGQLVFAARTPQSAYPDSNFFVGNILDGEIAKALDGYDLAGRLGTGANDTCRARAMKTTCGKGCPAALISCGQQIGEVDREQCPIVTSPVLQIGPRPQ